MPLTQRTGGGFNARRITVLQVTWGARVQLAEVFQIVDGEVKPERCSRSNSSMEPWPVERMNGRGRPTGVVQFGLVAAPQHFSDIRHSNGGARVTGVGFLNGIHTHARMALASSLREGICISCDCFI